MNFIATLSKKRRQVYANGQTIKKLKTKCLTMCIAVCWTLLELCFFKRIF